MLGLSHGTLLVGTYGEALHYVWTISREGTGIVRFCGNAVTLEWQTGWVTASTYDANIIQQHVPRALPLSSLICMLRS